MIQVIHNTYECDREYILTKHYFFSCEGRFREQGVSVLRRVLNLYELSADSGSVIR